MRYRYGPPEVVGAAGTSSVRCRPRARCSSGFAPHRSTAATSTASRRSRASFASSSVFGHRGIRRVGIDVAGVVEAVGPGVTRLKAGDQVMTDLFATGRFGSFAEYVCARESAVETIPAGMSFEEASTLPHGAVLALQGLRMRRGRTVKPGDRVLIGGASGSVGPFAVQIAKSLGAEVTGVTRTEKMERVRQLGADHVIDYTNGRLHPDRRAIRLDRRHRFPPPDPERRRALRPKGVYITLGGTTASILGGVIVGPLLSLFSDKWTGLMLWWKPFHRPDVETLKELIAAGKLRPVIDRVVSAGRGRRGAQVRRRWPRLGQGRDQHSRPGDPERMIRSVAHRLAGDRPDLPVEGRLPAFDGATGWLNSEPLTPEDLRGRVALVDFWTYTCVNWLRTLPYIRAWAEKYADRGPDRRRRPHAGVRLRARRRQRDRPGSRPRVEYPIALDNDYGVWRPSPTTSGRRSTSPTRRDGSATTTSARASTR